MSTTRRGLFGWLAGAVAAPVVADVMPVSAEVVTAFKASPISEGIAADTLSAIGADLGQFTAFKIVSDDGKFIFDLGRKTIKFDSDEDRTS